MAVVIRSYRNVFDLERRIYRVDRLRLNPAGVPVRGVAYFVVLAAAALLGGALPLVKLVVDLPPWYMRELAMPLAGAALLTVIRIEGRPFHTAAGALLRYVVGPRHVMAARRCAGPGRHRLEGDVAILADGSGRRMRRLRYTGPGAVHVAVAHERIEWRDGPLARLLRRPQLTLRELQGSKRPARGQVIVLRGGARLDVLPAEAAGTENTAARQRPRARSGGV